MMMMEMQIDKASTEEPIIVMRRTFAAPRETVWRVFTDPKLVAKWYGGHGFSSPRCEMDVRPGGLWHHVMRTPDGTEFPLELVFVEVVRPERIAWENVGHSERKTKGPPTCRNTITLEEAGPRTTAWKLVSLFHTIADRDLALQSGFTKMITQGSEKFDAIARALAEGEAS